MLNIRSAPSTSAPAGLRRPPLLTIVAPPPSVPAIAPATPWRRLSDVVRPFTGRPGFLVAAAFIGFVLLSALVPDLIARFDPYATAPLDKLLAPNATHWFGTDDLGRDLFARVVYGSTLSIRAGLLAVGIALAGGLGLGVLSGFVGGRVDAVIMRFVDVLLALPGFLLSLAVVTA